MGDSLMLNDKNLSHSRNKMRWKVIGASVRGASHTKSGQPCQDAHAWVKLPDSILVAAVSDGAGSAALAEVGADSAAKAAVRVLESKLTEGCLEHNECEEEDWRNLLKNALQSARQSIEETAIAHNCPSRDLAATLIVLVATPNCVAAAQVGDGAVVVGDADGNIIGLTTPQSGEYINETIFLTSPNYLSAVQFAFRRCDVSSVAVLSDGLQMLALQMPDGKPHAPFFAPLFRFVAGSLDNRIWAGRDAPPLRLPHLCEMDIGVCLCASPCLDNQIWAGRARRPYDYHVCVRWM
jgi:hypothetical protein